MPPMSSTLSNVLIYSGPGSCEFSVNQTLKTMNRFLKNRYDVKLVSIDVLRNEMIPWDENCALFVMPGGRDLNYMRDFDGSIIKRICKNVKFGKMCYFGICAGAYFASDRIEFCKGRSDGYEISQDRPLKLINCKAIGPIGKFYYSDDSNAGKQDIKESFQAVGIKIDSDEFKAAYSGGCYFESFQGDVEVKVLAKYSFNDGAAIISSENVCLSGVHLEYDAIDCLNCEKDNTTVFSELIKYEPQRETLLKRILSGTFGLILNESVDEDLQQVKIYSDISNIPDGLGPNVTIIREARIKEYQSIPNILYSRVTTSTQTILQSNPNFLDNLPNFSIYVADHQIKGRGRSSNLWISSPACLQFTLKLEHLFSKANQLPLMQFLMALSVTECINSNIRSSSTLKAKIKWPNDIYLCNETGCIGKVSGILVNCIQSHSKRVFQVLLGVGINLLSDPSLPNLTHINDHFSDNLFEKESFLKELLERFKHYHHQLMTFDEFPLQNYHSNWLHTNQIIESKDFPGKIFKIKGIDEFGYLIAEEVEEAVENYGKKLVKFEPDGNSFDMMKNLIQRK